MSEKISLDSSDGEGIRYFQFRTEYSWNSVNKMSKSMHNN